MSNNKLVEPRNPKGMRDFLPPDKKVRDSVLRQMISVFESYGFEPLETPAVELKEVLTGKLGTDEKLIYDVTYRGETKLALRYDLTIPFARVVAQNISGLPKPFKRYQTQAVYRADNPQKGRFRQFLQVDIDTAFSSNPLSDAEIIQMIIDTFKKLGFENFTVLINSREILRLALKNSDIPDEKLLSVASSLDKIAKIGRAGVVAELSGKGLAITVINKLFDSLKDSTPDENLKQIFDNLSVAGIDASKYKFDPFLARGLDYYTGAIYEVDIEGYPGGSVGGGGRYDNLISSFTNSNESIPAVGFSFGFDRILDALAEQNLLPDDSAVAKALVTIFRKEMENNSVETSLKLRSAGIAVELYTGSQALEGQLKYAASKGIAYAVIIGSEEVSSDTITLKNLSTREQFDKISQTEAITKLS